MLPESTLESLLYRRVCHRLLGALHDWRYAVLCARHATSVFTLNRTCAALLGELERVLPELISCKLTAAESSLSACPRRVAHSMTRSERGTQTVRPSQNSP